MSSEPRDVTGKCRMTSELKNINDQVLIQQTTGLVRQERELLTQVLEHLCEIDRRRLFSSLGYKSLFEFATKHLGYSEEAAYRRIQAMRLVQQLPEIEEKLEQGEVQLTHLSMAQKFFRKEAEAQNQPVSKEVKLELINKLVGTSVREAEKILIQQSSCPQELKPERIKVVTAEHVEVRLNLSQETLDQIEVLKGWLAHKRPNISVSQLFAELCQLGLKEWNPAREPKRTRTAKFELAESEQVKATQLPTVQSAMIASQLSSMAAVPIVEPKQKNQMTLTNPTTRSPQSAQLPQTIQTNQTRRPVSVAQRKIDRSNPRLIPAQMRRLVFQRAGNKCESCSSYYALEIDHTKPVALIGTSELKNLRLLCRSCNQRAAIQVLGVEKIEKHVRPESR
jgi:5-methylcytosine-specific restriction endonuclease McrA